MENYLNNTDNTNNTNNINNANNFGYGNNQNYVGYNMQNFEQIRLEIQERIKMLKQRQDEIEKKSLQISSEDNMREIQYIQNEINSLISYANNDRNLAMIVRNDKNLEEIAKNNNEDLDKAFFEQFLKSNGLIPMNERVDAYIKYDGVYKVNSKGELYKIGEDAKKKSAMLSDKTNDSKKQLEELKVQYPNLSDEQLKRIQAIMNEQSKNIQDNQDEKRKEFEEGQNKEKENGLTEKDLDKFGSKQSSINGNEKITSKETLNDYIGENFKTYRIILTYPNRIPLVCGIKDNGQIVNITDRFEMQKNSEVTQLNANGQVKEAQTEIKFRLKGYGGGVKDELVFALTKQDQNMGKKWSATIGKSSKTKENEIVNNFSANERNYQGERENNKKLIDYRANKDVDKDEEKLVKSYIENRKTGKTSDIVQRAGDNGNKEKTDYSIAIENLINEYHIDGNERQELIKRTEEILENNKNVTIQMALEVAADELDREHHQEKGENSKDYHKDVSDDVKEAEKETDEKLPEDGHNRDDRSLKNKKD